MKVRHRFSVRAYPTNRFRHPRQTRFALVERYGEYTPETWSENNGVFVDPVGNFAICKPEFVPKHNRMFTYTAGSPGSWGETPRAESGYAWSSNSAAILSNRPKWYICGVSAGATVAALPTNFAPYGEAWRTPWTRCLWSKHSAEACYVGHLGSPRGTPNTKNAYDPDTTDLYAAYGFVADPPAPNLWVAVPAGSTEEEKNATRPGLNLQGVHVVIGAELDPVETSWTGSAPNWTESRTYPDENALSPFYEVSFFLRKQGAAADDPYWAIYTLRFPHGGDPYVTESTWEMAVPDGIKLSEAKLSDLDDRGGIGLFAYPRKEVFRQSIRLGASLRTTMAPPSQGYFGWYGWGGSDGVGQGRPIEARCMNGLLQIAVDSHSRPLEIVVDPKASIAGLSVRFFKAREMFWAASPMAFLQSAPTVTVKEKANQPGKYEWVQETVPVYGVGPIREIGFAPIPGSFDASMSDSGDPDAKVEEYPAYKADETLVLAPTSKRVKLVLGKDTPDYTFDGKNIQVSTPVVERAYLTYREVEGELPGYPVELHPVSISISERFDLQGLTASASASLVFANHKPLESYYGDLPDGDIERSQTWWGTLSGFMGAFAVEIDLATDVLDVAGNVVETSNLVRVFTGYANLQSQVQIGDNGTATITCHDRWVQLRDPKFNLPWMDGWNVYYAAAFMAGMGGVRQGTVDETDLAFRHYVPPAPDGDVGNPDGGPTYFLPIGSGGYPLFKPHPGATPESMLHRIGKQGGYLRNFQRDGKLSFRKYALQSSAQPRRVFWTYDAGGLGGTHPSHVATIRGGVVSRDLIQSRNRIVVIGNKLHGPADSPVVAYRTDVEGKSVWSPEMHPFAPTAPNHTGFWQSLVWMDTMFGESNYAERVAEEMYKATSIPATSLQFATWLQPDIELGHRIGVHDLKSGTWEPTSNAYSEFIVVGHTMSYAYGGTGVSQITAQLIPPGTDTVVV